MKIINCFPYWGDDSLLEQRIKELQHVVDEFVIVESDRTWSGKPKPFYLEKIISRLNVDRNKIKILKCNLPKNNENYNNLVRDMFSLVVDDNTVAFITDEHEIINQKYIKYYSIVAQENLYGVLRIPMSCEPDTSNQTLWAYSFVCLKSHLDKYTISQLRFLNDKSENLINLFLKDNGVIERAGWCYLDKQHVEIENNKKINSQTNNNFTFVQIGSNHADNDVKKFIDRNNIIFDTGILVEPNALHHPLIKKTYNKDSRIKIVHKAIIPSELSERQINFYYHTKDGPKYSLSSCDVDFLIDQVIHNDYLKGGEIKSFEVECCTLEDLLDDFKLQKLDWLILNTTGVDENIVINFPWSRYNIKRIEIKNYWCKEKLDLIKSIFLDIGYKQSSSINDSYWAFVKNSD